MILTGGIGSILSRLYRTILVELGVSLDRYDALMVQYIRRVQRTGNRIERARARIGLSDELLKVSMTWKTFMLGLNFLNIVKFEMDLLLHYSGNTVSRHVRVVVPSEHTDDGEILGQVFKQILTEKNVDPDQYNQYLDDYIDRTRIKLKRKDRATIRASLSKELLKESMSWRTLVKGLVFLGVGKFTLTLSLIHRNDRTSQHHVTVLLDDFHEEEENESE